MSSQDEATRLRRRHDDLIRLAEPDVSPSEGSPALLLKTLTVGTYPTAAQSYYAVQAIRPGGTESEGSAVTFTAITGTFYAMNVGSAIPPSGTYVIGSLVRGRWVFRYDG